MKSLCVTAAAVTMLAGIQASSASTLVVNSRAQFDGLTTGQTTTDFTGIPDADLDNGAGCPGPSACYLGSTSLHIGNVTLTGDSGNYVNVDSAGYYGVDDLNVKYAVNAGGTNAITITFDSAVTAFGLDYGTLFEPSDVNFTLSNGDLVSLSPNLAQFETTFAGFISSVPFTSITFASLPSYPGDAVSEVIKDMTTAQAVTPIPATLPLLVTALGGLGLVGYRRKSRKAAAA